MIHGRIFIHCLGATRARSGHVDAGGTMEHGQGTARGRAGHEGNWVGHEHKTTEIGVRHDGRKEVLHFILSHP